MPFAQRAHLARIDRGLLRQPIPDRYAVLPQTQPAANRIEKVGQHARGGGGRCRGACEEIAADVDERGDIDGTPAGRVHAQPLYSQHEHQPQEYQPRDAPVQPRIGEKSSGIIVVDDALMGVVENHGAARLQRPSQNVRQQPTVVGGRQLAIAEQAGEPDGDHLSVAFAAQPDRCIVAALDVRDLEHGGSVRRGRPPTRRGILRGRPQRMHVPQQWMQAARCDDAGAVSEQIPKTAAQPGLNILLGVRVAELHLEAAEPVHFIDQTRSVRDRPSRSVIECRHHQQGIAVAHPLLEGENFRRLRLEFVGQKGQQQITAAGRAEGSLQAAVTFAPGSNGHSRRLQPAPGDLIAVRPGLRARGARGRRFR